MSRQDDPAAKRQKQSRRHGVLHTLDELSRLRGQLPRTSASRAQPAAGKKTDVSPPASVPQSNSPDEDTRLFRTSLRDVTPLKDSGRVEIETPRPAPLPRRPEKEAVSEPEHSDVRSLDELSDEAYFLAMMEEVLPQKGDNRIESGPSARRTRHASPEDGNVFTPLLAGVLPSDADAMTPETLFRLATSGIQPLDQRNRAEIEQQRPRPDPLKREEDEQSALHESLHAPMTLEDRLEGGDETTFIRPGLPRRTLADLRRGRWILQGEIDLHGFNRDEARIALSQFLLTCLQQGRRCVRVIHGKGLGSPGKESILKQLSRGWLAQREEILAFCQAGPNQGGSGALLVLLKSRNARYRPSFHDADNEQN